MTFESIILKLLPFTYIDNEKVKFGVWSDLSDGDKIITFVELFLIVLFTWYIVKLILSWLKDKKQINLLVNILDKYRNKIKENYKDGHLDISNEYTELIEDINSTNPKLQKLWKEFDESLIKKYNGEEFVIRNSIDAEYFFNKKTMISHLGSKLYASIPGMLLGIGLLGTFFGLYFALIQINFNDAKLAEKSIQTLINIAGVKFAASIWGLGLSVIFTFIDKILESGLEKKLDEIQVIIDQIFIRETAEQNLDSILLQNTQQTKALNGLATSLTEKIAAEFNTSLIPKIALMNSHFENMPQQISQSINETFQKPLEQLSNTVENLTTNQAEKSNEALENIIKEFMQDLTSAAGNEGEKLKEVTAHSSDILLSTSEQLQNTFITMQNMFQEQQNISKLRDEKILQDLNQIKIDQQNMIQNLSINVTENVELMNQKVSTNINDLVNTIQATSIKQQEDSQQRENLITSSVNNMISHIEKSMSKQINQFDNHIDGVKSNIDTILNNLKMEVQNIDVIMSSTSKKLIGLPNHLEKVAQSTDKLLQFSNDLTQSTDKLLRFNHDFIATQENLDKYSENILSASNELKLADNNIKETLETSHTLLNEMNNKFGELANKNSDTIEEFGNKVDNFMNNYHKHVEKAIQDNIIHQLDNSLSSYAQTMAEAITSLSDAIDELREKEIR